MIKIGDLVRSRSGGPLMTITSEAYECSWFVGRELKKGWFAASELIVVETAPSTSPGPQGGENLGDE